ncbi:hypothetical protein A0H81_08834 [Grifola frondosa]|uniref:Uncharacterized protein n=1 Tax=Grifola frondosa TaxID=5627 RepID=A0A1C7M9F4_GRIFR|nr:hypothetical protein A0H81_08834 [Grifola frondosa]
MSSGQQLTSGSSGVVIDHWTPRTPKITSSGTPRSTTYCTIALARAPLCINNAVSEGANRSAHTKRRAPLNAASKVTVKVQYRVKGPTIFLTSLHLQRRATPEMHTYPRICIPTTLRGSLSRCECCRP